MVINIYLIYSNICSFSRGMQKELASPYTPYHNDIIKMMNRTIKECDMNMHSHEELLVNLPSKWTYHLEIQPNEKPNKSKTHFVAKEL